MYSRRFADAPREVPADYNGVAYSGEKEVGRDAIREEEKRREEPAGYPEACAARRPLYRAPRGAVRGSGESREKRRPPAPHNGGERRFSGEDLLLAGLILTLLSDREEGEKPDGEMLLILGLLLFIQ